MGIGFECCCDCTRSFNVRGCSYPNPSGGGYSYDHPACSVSYTLNGTTYGPFRTDGSGQVVLTVSDTGTASVTVTPDDTRYAAQTFTATLGCNVVSNLPTQVNLIPAAGYQCAAPGCCSPATTASGPPYLTSDISYPGTLYLSDGFGTVTMSGSGGPGWGAYTGCAMRTAASVYVPDEVTFGPGSYQSNVAVPVFFTLSCGGTNPPTAVLTVDFARYDGSPYGGPCQPVGTCGSGEPNTVQLTKGSAGPTCTNHGCGYLDRPSSSTSVVPAPACPPGSVSLSFSVGPYHAGVACFTNHDQSLEDAPFQVYGSGGTGISVTS